MLTLPSFQVLLALLLCTLQTLALDFSNSKWIYIDTNSIDSSGTAPPGPTAFRRDFPSQRGKEALSARILIAADKGYTLFVNGQQVGAPANDWRAAQVYCVRLAPDRNVFAVRVTNANEGEDEDEDEDEDLAVRSPAGLIVAIEVRYTDGVIDEVVSDSRWLSFASVPDGFQEVGFDDSKWLPATVEGDYGIPPWGAITLPATASSAPLSLTNANWIWTNESQPGQAAPVGARAFRRDITLPAGQQATSATFLIAADDAYTVYLQNQIVGSSTSYRTAQRFVVADIPPPPPASSSSQLAIAVFAANFDGPAGLIAAVELGMADGACGSAVSFVTDSSWRYDVSPPVGFQEARFDAASAWPRAVVQGKHGVQPWGNVPVPTAISDSTAPIPGAPPASSAKVVNMK